MSETSTSTVNGHDAATPEVRARLSFDLDVDIAIVGAGLAGLTVALEGARLGASIAVLEGRHVGWGASGHHLGTVMPGFGLAVADLVERVGHEDARELWALSNEGADYVRHLATEQSIPGIGLSEGALEVSNVDAGEALISRLQALSGDFDTEVEGWQVDRVRSELRTDRYFHGVYYPKAFQIDSRKYVHGLAALARRAGARIFEDTPVVSIDPSGIRKRIVTPSARLRASHIVLCGNVHLGAPLRRLSETLLPVWRYAAVSEPLGERLAEVVAFKGSVMDSDGIDHFRVVEGDRLMWASPETTWAMEDNGSEMVLDAEYAATLMTEIDIDAAIEQCGIFIVLVDHDVFKSVPLDERTGKAVYDTRGIWRDQPERLTAKGLLRRVVSKIFGVEVKGWCSEFEARNAAGGAAVAEAVG